MYLNHFQVEFLSIYSLFYWFGAALTWIVSLLL